MSKWISLALLAALFGAWTAAPVFAAPQKVEEVKKKETKQRAGQEAGKQEEHGEEGGAEHQEGAEAEAGHDQDDKAEGGWGGAKEGAAEVKKTPGTDIALLRQVAAEEGRYRKRAAQVKRAREVATEKGDEKSLERIAALEQKNEKHHSKRLDELRDKYGADHVDASLERIEKGRKSMLKGKGGVKAEKLRQKGKAKGEEMRQNDKDKVQKAKEKAKGKGKKEKTEGGDE